MKRGQAMLEYSLINLILVGGLMLGLTFKWTPDPTEPLVQKSFVELFIDSYQAYADSFYYVLNSPYP